MKMFFLALVVSSTAFAGMTKDQAFQAGKDDGLKAKGQMIKGVTTSKAMDVVPKYNNNAQESSFYKGGQGILGNYGQAKITGCATNKASNKYDQQECDAINFLIKSTQDRPKFKMDSTDVMISNSKRIIAGAKKSISQTQCVIKKIVGKAEYSYDVCKEYGTLTTQMCTAGVVIDVTKDSVYKCTEQNQQVIDSSCAVGRSIVVDSNTRYECQITKNAYEQISCHKKYTATCTGGGDNCAMGGVVPNSVNVSNGSYIFTFDGSTLTLQNKITKTNSVTNANFDFNIDGYSKLTVFSITSIHSDNWVGLSVNGVYIGTHSRFFSGFSTASDRLEVKNLPDCSFSCTRVYYTATKYTAPETGANYLSNVTFDLIPYLKEGKNTITMYVVNGGGPGNGTVTISAKQKCDPLCSFAAYNECQPLEERAK